MGSIFVFCSDYEKSRAWLHAKAKDAGSLSADKEAYLDLEMASKLRERTEHEVSVRWWQPRQQSLRKARARKLAGLCKSLKGLKLKCLKGYRENSMAG